MTNTNLKHAYCIIAHGEPVLLKTLIDLIDDARNDIFLEIDKKTDINLFKGVVPKHANLYFAERVDARWGDISLISAEYSVFECAYNHGPYLIYHLLSGVDLPIKSQNYIHSFIEQHPNTEFLSFCFDEANQKDIEAKTRYYHLFTRYYRQLYLTFPKLSSCLFAFFEKIQKLVGVRRCYPVRLCKGAQWCSITNELCEYLLSKKSEILSMYKFTFCCDELFLQTLVWNSEFMNRVYINQDNNYSCLREIDWKRGFPYIWGSLENEEDQEMDINRLKRSSGLFARKFSINHRWIINKVDEICNSCNVEWDYETAEGSDGTNSIRDGR